MVCSGHTFFAATVAGHGIDLMAPPWLACRYESVRAPGGACVAVFTPDALREPAGGLDATRRRWTCTATRNHVMMRDDIDPSQRFEWGD